MQCEALACGTTQQKLILTMQRRFPRHADDVAALRGTIHLPPITASLATLAAARAACLCLTMLQRGGAAAATPTLLLQARRAMDDLASARAEAQERKQQAFQQYLSICRVYYRTRRRGWGTHDAILEELLQRRAGKATSPSVLLSCVWVARDLWLSAYTEARIEIDTAPLTSLVQDAEAQEQQAAAALLSLAQQVRC